MVRRSYTIIAVLIVIIIATFIGLKGTEQNGNGRFVTLQQIDAMVNTGKLPKSVLYLAAFEKLKNPYVYFKENNGVIYVYNGSSNQIKLTGKNWHYTVYKGNVLRGRVILKNGSLTFMDVCLNPVNDKYFTLILNLNKLAKESVKASVTVEIYGKSKQTKVNLTKKDLGIANALASQIVSESKKSNLSKEYEIGLVTYGLGSAISKRNDFALNLSKFSVRLVKLNQSNVGNVTCKFEKILIFGSGSVNSSLNVDAKSLNTAIFDSAILNCIGYNTSVLVKNSEAYLLIKNIKLVYTPIKIHNCTCYVYNPITGYPVSKL